MTKRNPEFGGFSACFAVRAETDQKGKATPPARTETWCGALTPLAGINFNPLRPRGRRRLNQDRTASIRNFNPLRPRGRRRNSLIFSTASYSISTHSAREDGDYIPAHMVPAPPISTHSAREDGDSNTTQKNKQFFITFPQSNHIILPQITANLPCTHPKPFSLCSFSGANPPVNSCLLLVRTKLFETSLPPAARSEYQRLFHFNPFTHPNMVHLCSVFISQVVKSKAVSLLINDICQYGF